MKRFEHERFEFRTFVFRFLALVERMLKVLTDRIVLGLSYHRSVVARHATRRI